MNPEALVREIQDYITPQKSLSSNFPSLVSSQTDPRDKEIASLKKDLILSARVGKSLLLQLHKMESQLARQESDFRAKTSQLAAANGALVDENSTLMDQSRQALEQITDLETQIAQLSGRLADANSRCLRLNSYYSLAQSLEQQVDMLESIQSELRQDVAYAERDRTAMEKRAKRAEKLAESIAANFRGLSESAAIERPPTDPLSYGELSKPLVNLLAARGDLPTRAKSYSKPQLPTSQDSDAQDSDDTQAELPLSSSSVEVSHIADLSIDSRFEPMDASLADTSFQSMDASFEPDMTADTTIGSIDVGIASANIASADKVLPDAASERSHKSELHGDSDDLRRTVRPQISMSGLLPATSNISAVQIEADQLSKELPLRQKLSREPIEPEAKEAAAPRSTLAPHILAALERPTLRRSQSHESVFSEYDSPALNSAGKATSAISGSAATAAPATNAATARQRLLNVQQTRKTKGWFMPFR